MKIKLYQGFRYLGWYRAPPARGGWGECRHRPAGPGECPTALRACPGHHRNRSGWSRESTSDPKTKFRDFPKKRLFKKNDNWCKWSSESHTHNVPLLPGRVPLPSSFSGPTRYAYSNRSKFLPISIKNNVFFENSKNVRDIFRKKGRMRVSRRFRK